MSDTGNTELEKRLAALEKGSARAPTAAQRRSPLLALIVVLIIGAGGALLFLLSQPDEEEALPTASSGRFSERSPSERTAPSLPSTRSAVSLMTASPRAFTMRMPSRMTSSSFGSNCIGGRK